MSIADLPNELLIPILDSLSFQDAIHCALVCKRFNSVIVSNFSKYYIDVWKHGEAAPVSIVYPEADFRSITSQGGRNAHFFEFHPFTKHLYRTGTGNDLHKHDWYLFAAIPNSSSVAYIDRTESALIVYDMKKSMEVARLVDPSVRGARNLICSKNALVVSSYADFNRGYLMASIVCVWSASKLEKVRTIVGREAKSDFVPRLSASGQLAFHSRNNLKTITLIDCASMEGVHYGYAPIIHQKLKPGHEPSEPATDSLEINESERIYAISGDGQLLVTIFELVDHNRKQLSIYDIKTKQIIFKFVRSWDRFRQNCHVIFSEDNRLILLKKSRHPEMEIIDLQKKKSLLLANGGEMLFLIRKFDGGYQLQTFRWDDTFEWQKIDLASENWRSVTPEKKMPRGRMVHFVTTLTAQITKFL